MLLYKSKLRVGIVALRLFLSFLALLLFIAGFLGAIGMALSKDPEISALVFVIGIMTLSVLVFKISGWNIRQYIIYDDRLEIRILGGVKTVTYPASMLAAFNDLKVLVLNRSGGIGIVTTQNKLIKVLELEVKEFPEFIDHLQRIVRWDLSLKFEGVGGFAR